MFHIGHRGQFVLWKEYCWIMGFLMNTPKIMLPIIILLQPNLHDFHPNDHFVPYVDTWVIIHARDVALGFVPYDAMKLILKQGA